MSRGTQKGSLLQNICSPTDFLDPHGHVLTEKSSIEGGNLLFPVGCTCWLVQFVLILLLNPQPSPPAPPPFSPPRRCPYGLGTTPQIRLVCVNLGVVLQCWLAMNFYKDLLGSGSCVTYAGKKEQIQICQQLWTDCYKNVYLFACVFLAMMVPDEFW